MTIRSFHYWRLVHRWQLWMEEAMLANVGCLPPERQKIGRRSLVWKGRMADSSANRRIRLEKQKRVVGRIRAGAAAACRRNAGGGGGADRGW